MGRYPTNTYWKIVWWTKQFVNMLKKYQNIIFQTVFITYFTIYLRMLLPAVHVSLVVFSSFILGFIFDCVAIFRSSLSRDKPSSKPRSDGLVTLENTVYESPCSFSTAQRWAITFERSVCPWAFHIVHCLYLW